MNNRGAICLVSGGVDSVTCLYYVKYRIKPSDLKIIFCNYGQRTFKEEEFCIRKISSMLDCELRIINLDWLGEISTSLLTKKDIEIPETKVEDLQDPEKAKARILRWWDPARNAILILVALAHAEALDIKFSRKYDVFIGIRRETPVAMKDNTPEFLEEMNRVAEIATHYGGYKVYAPLITYDKDKVVKLGQELEVPWKYTYSCYRGNLGFKEIDGEVLPIHCGWCSNCKRRALAFKLAGVKDPSVYFKNPL
ncbi:MAG TPA: 7-cyano-7-deazaguanine synthase [Geobacterales bacterium]|nr:7-cyano-7-deazaguanine synthase [Geobacterales bacterium]